MTLLDDPVHVPVTLGTKPATLSYREARVSPCLSCTTSPCCQFLPLHSFQITDLMELDHAVYLVNFAHIVLGVSSSGDWGVYYRMPCRYLSVEDGLCTVHGTPDQPSICQHYNPYQCWYRRVLTVDTHDDFLVVDRGRLAWVLDRIAFDDGRRIVEVPHWDDMVEAFASIPLAEPEPVSAPPSSNGWHPVELGARSVASAASAPDPCTGCGAWCCSTLIFPTGTPTTFAQLDFLRFALGFPGVELGIGDAGWSVVVRTTCRHLQHGRCSVYGSEERPLLCTYYDALRCTYKVQFGTPNPEGFVHVRLEDMTALASLFIFDADGRAAQVPGPDAVRETLRSQ